MLPGSVERMGAVVSEAVCNERWVAPRIEIPNSMRHPQRLERPVRRRWERAGRKDAEFVVLRLRRITDPFYRSEGTGVGLDKRIKVRGHWRRQYFPSLGHARHADGTMNPASHRLVWIDEHWRGPEDAPLGPLHHATSVVR